ncbi:MAG: VCBS repeat-containing protein [Gammaproteobacteria bacterium]|nr:VCBS repeat-containing protein [Gammaproteobacteria bacterium]MCP5198007.1 VCBS repeat-containing protein [Gammaproteobacteria bacterium]
MKIASSNIQLVSQHTAVTHHEVKESLRMWVGDRRPDFEGRGQSNPPGQARLDTVHLSQAARAAQPSKEVASEDTELLPEDELKLGILIRMIENLTGKKIKLVSPKELREQMGKIQEQAAETAQVLEKAQSQTPERAGFGIEYDYYERHYEAEKTTFSAEGVIKTQDGKEIAFSVDLSMSRQFLQEQSASLRIGDAKLKDPLTLNFGGHAAELTTTRFSFDIDSDGRQDQIAFVGPNSGFLALDRNGDGIINNGQELFGASTGQGFAELAQYDEDGNQWIDENDSIYQNLRIWSKDAQGQDQLVGLGERGVGAIYLGHVTTPFALKDDQNALLGQIRESGIFLQEDGTVGTVQQIDLSV